MSAVAALSPAAKAYWGQWGRLEMSEGVLVRTFYPKVGPPARQIVLPSKLQKAVLEKLHDDPSGGRMGSQRTLAQVQGRFSWHRMKEAIVRWCQKCASWKRPRKTPQSALGSVPVGGAGERVGTDIMEPLQETDRINLCILVVQDHFTKWMECYPSPNQEAKLCTTGSPDMARLWSCTVTRAGIVSLPWSRECASCWASPRPTQCLPPPV